MAHSQFPVLPEALRVARLAPPRGLVQCVLDTDTYNEVDDQFALAYALLSPQSMNLQAVYAAPFHNSRSTGPEDGMVKSYEEIKRVMDKMGIARDNFVFEGSRSWLIDSNEPVDSPAARDLINKAMACENEPLYVMTIGAPTNIASALLLEPELVRHIVVVWLAGQPHDWRTAREFNLQQDLFASRILFDSGVPLMQIPCTNVAEHLSVTIPELDAFLGGKNALGQYLCDIVRGYTKDPFGWSKVIWDISAVAWLINPQWLDSTLVHSPVLSNQFTYNQDFTRHLMRVALHLNRDAIFRDLYQKIGGC
ncbi:MAG: nucleoside hydrolase [Lentisphaerae bacterium]|nr:nucleoside hydrolase [Lentisphaerota bacterium]